MMAMAEAPCHRLRSGMIASCAGLALLTGFPALATEQPQPLKDRYPLTVEAVELMTFGKIGVQGSGTGTVTIDPRRNRKSVGGSARDLGGNHSAARFVIRGQPDARFSIRLPGRIELAGAGGGNSFGVLENFTSHPAGEAVLGPDGKASIRVGATWKFQPTSAGGHRTDFTVSVSYMD